MYMNLLSLFLSLIQIESSFCWKDKQNSSSSSSKTMANPALEPDLDKPDQSGHEFAQFGAGCFWGLELAFQRVDGVVKTEVGYSQGHVHDPNYRLVCTGTTNHAEVVRVQFDPVVCPYTNLLSVFWGRHDPTTLNRQVSLFYMTVWGRIITSCI